MWSDISSAGVSKFEITGRPRTSNNLLWVLGRRYFLSRQQPVLKWKEKYFSSFSVTSFWFHITQSLKSLYIYIYILLHTLYFCVYVHFCMYIYSSCNFKREVFFQLNRYKSQTWNKRNGKIFQSIKFIQSSNAHIFPSTTIHLRKIRLHVAFKHFFNSL